VVHDCVGQEDFGRRAELLVDLAVQVEKALKEVGGLEAAAAVQIGREIAGWMADHWGGQHIYFPKDVSYKVSQRDQQIFAEFNGSNHAELARKYDVSAVWIYRVVKKVLLAERAKRQSDLFAE
jgi:Mor family transcriptional regulator